MTSVLTGIGIEAVRILEESAPYVLFGFLAAGVIKAFVSDESVARHLGEKSIGSVLKASLLGIPLPLCSCGVLPTAINLRKQGASKGASAAFMVSTPESGVDSIAITWALLDPIMTIARPVAAFFTATVTGLSINALPEEAASAVEELQEGNDRGCSSGCSTGELEQGRSGPGRRILSGIKYAFGDLLAEIGIWLLIGIALAGVISYLVPPDLFTRYLGSEFTSLLIMLVVGIPLYICATASTPIAAALVLKGLSPGAALVFLLAGPATNLATITVIGKHWGRKTTLAYLASIAGCSVLLGWLLNRIYFWLGADITRWIQSGGADASNPFTMISSLLLVFLIALNFRPGSRSSREEDNLS